MLAIAIVSVLVSGLLIGTGGFLSDQRERAARMELESLGDRIAGELASADRLSRNGGAVNLTIERPRTVAGSPYRTTLVRDPDCAGACLRLTATRTSTVVRVPVGNRSPVSLERDGERFWINASPRTTATATAAAGIELNVDSNIGVGRGVDTNPPKGSVVRATNQRPIAGFWFEPSTPGVGREVRFYNVTDDVDGIVTNFSWDVTDDGSFERAGPTEGRTNWTYAEPGQYDVTLQVTDDEGDTGNATKRVVVSGLVYNRDATAEDHDSSGDNEPGGVRFSLTNRFADNGSFDGSVELRRMFVKPRPPNGSDRLDEGDVIGREVEFDTDGTHPDNRDGYVDYWSGIPYDGSGAMEIDLDSAPYGSAGPTPVLGPGANATVVLSEFRDDVDARNEKFYVVLKYEVNTTGPPGSSDLYYYNFSLDPTGLSTSVLAAFDYAPTPPTAGQSVTFDADDSYATGGDSIVAYEWDLDDDGTFERSGETVTDTFSTPGTTQVTLRVEGASGATNTVTQAVDVRPAATGSVLWAVNAGGSEEVVDGVTYEEDTTGDPSDYLVIDSGGNQASSDGDAVANADAAEQPLYRTERYATGDFGYDVPVPDGQYAVTFKFAEIYFSSDGDASPGDGQRIFDVEAEGSTVRDDLDVYDEVGGHTAYDVTTTVTVSDGTLNLDFEQDSANNPKLSAVVVRGLDPAFRMDDSTDEVFVEAESFHDRRGELGGSHEWVVSSGSDVSNGEYVEGASNDGTNFDGDERAPVLNYTIDFSEPGDYVVWARMEEGSLGGSSDSIQVGLDGGPIVDDGSVGFSAPGSWDWTNDDDTTVTVDVPSAGRHTLNVYMRESGTRLDKLHLVEESDSAEPSGYSQPESPNYDLDPGAVSRPPLDARPSLGFAETVPGRVRADGPRPPLGSSAVPARAVEPGSTRGGRP